MLNLLLLGSTNVGKSTLFNLLVAKKQALVADIPGLTKDWEEGICVIQGQQVRVIDTPGLEKESLTQNLPEPWHSLIGEATVVCIVTDGTKGLTALDQEISHCLRRYGKTCLVIVNKMDHALARKNFSDFFTLAGEQTIQLVATRRQDRGELCRILAQYLLHASSDCTDDTSDSSAQVDSGIANFVDAGRFQTKTDAEEEDAEEEGSADSAAGALIRLVVLGKPNSGKSSLINNILGYERLAVSPVAGTTHNAVTVDCVLRNQTLALTDTAGVRRRKNMDSALERVTTQQSWLMVEKVAEVVLMLVDITIGITKQDWVLVSETLDMGKPVLVCFNKIDLITDEHRARIGKIERMNSFRVAFISSKTGEGVNAMIRQISDIRKAWSSQISTPHLNKWLRDCTERYSPPYSGGKRLKLKYMVQTSVSMPRFLIFSNAEIPNNYLSYLQGAMRKSFNMWSVPLKIEQRVQEPRKRSKTK